MASPMYARLELVRLAKYFREKADENMELAQQHYKKYYDRQFRIALILGVGDYIYLDIPPVFRSAVERSDSER